MQLRHITMTTEPITVWLGPGSRHQDATEYLRLARLAIPSKGFSRPCYSLYCESIELALKAFALARGATETELIGIGHSLPKALAKAKALGLNTLITVSPDEKADLDKANEYYSTKRFLYADFSSTFPQFMDLPSLESLDVLATRLLEATRSECWGTTLSRPADGLWSDRKLAQEQKRQARKSPDVGGAGT